MVVGGRERLTASALDDGVIVATGFSVVTFPGSKKSGIDIGPRLSREFSITLTECRTIDVENFVEPGPEEWQVTSLRISWHVTWASDRVLSAPMVDDGNSKSKIACRNGINGTCYPERRNGIIVALEIASSKPQTASRAGKRSFGRRAHGK